MSETERSHPKESECEVCGDLTLGKKCGDCEAKLRVAHMLLTDKPWLIEYAAEYRNDVEVEVREIQPDTDPEDPTR